MDIWSELAKQVPALAVLVFLVIKFLSFLEGQRVAQVSSDERLAEAIDNLSREVRSSQDVNDSLHKALNHTNFDVSHLD